MNISGDFGATLLLFVGSAFLESGFSRLGRTPCSFHVEAWRAPRAPRAYAQWAIVASHAEKAASAEMIMF